MDDKYFKLQDIVLDTFDLNAPVEIEKGVLLLDKTSKNVFLQLKLNVLGIDTSRLSSVSLGIECLDDATDTIADISPYTFTYRDIFLNKSKTFGEDNPILLDQRVRRVKVGIHRVVFTDASTWLPTAQEFTPSKQELINSLKLELVEQFQRNIRFFSPAVKESYKYIPKQLEGYWLCTCGRPNANVAKICSRCGLSKKKVINISADILQKKFDEHKELTRLDEEKARIASEQARLQEIEKARFEKEQVRLFEIEKARKREEDIARLHEEERVRVKKITIYILVTAFAAVLIVVFIFAILPAMKYSQASIYLANKDFDNAISVLESLGEYKDSANLLLEANYQLGLWYQNDTKQYEEAASIFTSLSNYKDSSELSLELNYKLAVNAYTQGDFETAQTYFNAVSEYKDVGNYLDNLQILMAAQGRWYCYGTEVVINFYKWAVFRRANWEMNETLISNYSENSIAEDRLVIRSSDSTEYVFDYSEQKITVFPRNGKPGECSKYKFENGSSSTSSSSSSSSSSSECDTLINNLDLALLLSGGATTDLTVLYTKALMDNGCLD